MHTPLPMRQSFRIIDVFSFLAVTFVLFQSQSEGYEVHTVTCDAEPAAYLEFCAEMTQQHPYNLLAFPGAKVVVQEHFEGNLAELTDGNGGELAGHGRVQADGRPARIIYYLGGLRSIAEIAVWSGNGDSRANQDFEIRLADNSAHPGQMPDFTESVCFTSGNSIIGNNRGGCKTSIIPKQGESLYNGKAFDWIEFRFWQTYPSNAGEPGKQAGKATSWTSLVELQVLARKDWNGVFATDEEKNVWLIRQLWAKYSSKLEDLIPQAAVTLRDPASLGLMIDDLGKTFPEHFPADRYRTEWQQFLARFAQLTRDTKSDEQEILHQYRSLVVDYLAFQRKVVLAHPLLDFDRLLFVKRPAGEIATPSNNSYTTESVSKHIASELCTLERTSSSWEVAKVRTVFKPNHPLTILDPDLDFDGQHVLFSMQGENGRWHLFEQNLESDDPPKQMTKNLDEIDSFDACYLSDGQIVFGSNACFQGLPCESGRVQMGLLYRLDRKTGEIRQLTFEQDSDWCPTIDNFGRVMYLRWEYTDTPHYFTRLLFTMNPDGTKQLAHYGSNSYWPNSLFYAKPIPGDTSKFIGTVTGHHISRPGRLVLFDVQKGRENTDGVIQALPGRNETVEPIIVDGLYDNVRPQFLQVHPLGTGEEDGAGKYFLAAGNMGGPKQIWGIYMIDVFDNITPILVDEAFALTDPIPVQSRFRPPSIPDRIVPGEMDATFFITDVYYGPGLKDIPRDKVKSLRIFSYHFSFPHTGHNDVVGIESSWDVKRILGTVPVEKDGSAFFTAPANTPISIQPLDEQGRALQLMRSWTVGMQGENVSCIGCHESQNEVTPTALTLASQKPPHPITPRRGETRGFGFLHEVQPVLDKYCIGCHDGTQDPKDEIYTTGTDGIKGRPNFKDYSLMTVTDGADRQIGPFYRSYVELRAYVRTPGPESDYFLFRPMEYHVSTSPLFQMLESGHHGVKLDAESWERLAAWVDLNAPCYETWTEAHRHWANKVLLDWMGIDRERQMNDLEKYRQLRSQYAELYAGIFEDPEADTVSEMEMYDRIEKFRKDNPPIIPDFKEEVRPVSTDWAFSQEKAVEMQKQTAPHGETTLTIELQRGNTMEFRWIPPGIYETVNGKENIAHGFWMGATEVTNQQYACFDPAHDSRYVDEMAKDHTRPGVPANNPRQPVSRVSLSDAQKFCQWLNENCRDVKEKDCRVVIPTETQWMWACQAGASTPLWYGKLDDDFSKYANLADRSLSRFHHGQGAVDFYRRLPVDDGQQIMGDVGRYQPNPWGLYDMHGNVAEMTTMERQQAGKSAAVKGGSWFDWTKRAAVSFRAVFPDYQKLPDTGFRVVLEERR
ncbi:MAG: SUMF1/EgtB/PvdO family nonheme iron enzyme [Planctomycetaceae bacterium]|nr:SUMF1/EgtB/PvdO family nonheme iron enzyme [Planctomycetaceae bacterium]